MSTGTRERAGALRHHAAPLDAVDEVAPDNAGGVTASKLVQIDDPYQEGHYPGFAIFPGIFIIEAAVQTCRGACAARGLEDPGTVLAISSARFTIPLFPGDTLVLRAGAGEVRDDGNLRVRVRCEKDGALAARVTLIFAAAVA